MSTAEYFDLTPPGIPTAERTPVSALPSEKIIHPVSESRVTVRLEEVLYSGQALSGQWRLVLFMADKLWISKDLQLYFGHNVLAKNMVYQGPLNIVQQRLDFDLDINASNRFGEVLHKKEHIRQCITADRTQYHALVSLERNWTRLMLKLAIHIA